MPFQIHQVVGRRLPTALLGRAIKITFLACRKNLGEYTLSVAFVDDQVSRRLNRRFRHRNQTASVLSFALSKHSGEIIIAYPEARRRARSQHLTVTEEVCTLLIHGLLHCFGYDHAKASAIGPMERLEAKLQELLLIPDLPRSLARSH